MSKEKYLVFDVESTGIDVFEDRIVQLVISRCDEDGNVLGTKEWIIDPGVEVPEGAADVHGFTTEFLQENGLAPDIAMNGALDEFEEGLDLGLTFVAYNMNYDLSILDSEIRRIFGEQTFGSGIAETAVLLDPLVVDRAKDKYRKGKRTLEAVSGHYGVPFDPEAAHKADYDVEVTAKVAAKIEKKYGQPSTSEQAAWYASWAKGLQSYLRKKDPTAVVDGDWPLRKEA